MDGIPENKPFQLTFELPHDVAMGREDFLVSDSNRNALDLVEAWPDWPSKFVILAGPTGAGKTHLVEIWKSISNAESFEASELGKIDLTRITQQTSIAVENAGSSELDQLVLFHLMNTITQSGSNLLITSRNWPSSWGVTLPDLESRLRLATLVEVSEPDDNLLRQVLFKLFVDRQLDVKMPVIDYLVMRMERSIKAASEIVHAIDQFTLRERRPITKPVASEVLTALLENPDN